MFFIPNYQGNAKLKLLQDTTLTPSSPQLHLYLALPHPTSTFISPTSPLHPSSPLPHPTYVTPPLPSLTHSEWLSSRNLPSVLEKVERERNRIHCWWGVQINTASVNISLEIPQKFKIELLHGPTISSCTCALRSPCPAIEIFGLLFTALFTVAKSWDQPI